MEFYTLNILYNSNCHSCYFVYAKQLMYKCNNNENCIANEEPNCKPEAILSRKGKQPLEGNTKKTYCL